MPYIVYRHCGITIPRALRCISMVEAEADAGIQERYIMRGLFCMEVLGIKLCRGIWCRETWTEERLVKLRRAMW